MDTTCRVCSKCGESKELTQFLPIRKGNWRGLRGECNTCRVAYKEQRWARRVSEGCSICSQCRQKKGIEQFSKGQTECRDCAQRRKRRRWAAGLLDTAARNSRARGHEPPTLDEAWVLSQPLRCPYLGVPLIVSETEGAHRNPWAPSLDRIDNSRGYTPDNVLLTSWFWNCLRGPLSVEEALKAIEIVKHADLMAKVA